MINKYTNNFAFLLISKFKIVNLLNFSYYKIKIQMKNFEESTI